MFWVKDITHLFHFRHMWLQSNDPQNPSKNKKNGKGFGISETASPKLQKTMI